MPSLAPQAQREASVLGAIEECDGTLPTFIQKLIDHAPDSFADRRCGFIAAEIRSMLRAAEPVGTIALKRRVKSGGPDGTALVLSAMNAEALTPALAELEADSLWEAYQARVIAQTGDDMKHALDAKSDPGQVVEHAITALQSIAESSKAQPNAWRQRRYNPEKAVQEPRPVFKLAGVTVGTPGNIGVIMAPIKAGKTAVGEAMMASVIVAEIPGDSERDTFSFTSSNPDGRAVVHIDTEQTEGDHAKVLRRVQKRAQVDELPPWFYSYWLKGLTAQECLQSLQAITTNAAKECGGVHSIIIDGVADLVVNVNDPEECNPFVSGLEAMAVDYDCHIVAVIHFNPGSDKSRGHLGSQLERKAESNLTLKKTNETTVIFSAKQRGAPIPEDKGPCFTFCSVAGMHVSCESLSKHKKREEYEAASLQAKTAFNGSPALRYVELKNATVKHLGVSESTAERRIKLWRQLGIVQDAAGNLLELSHL